MFKRIMALSFILVCASMGWSYLESVMESRTAESSQALSDAVGGLWGTPHTQSAPKARFDYEVVEKVKGKPVKFPRTTQADPAASEVKVDVNLEQRKKGLLWFSTYTVNFGGDYKIKNPTKYDAKVRVTFPFPSDKAVYDKVVALPAGKEEFEVRAEKNSMIVEFKLPPESERVVAFGYESRGLDRWDYTFNGADMIKNFNLTMTTNFDHIDFPRDSVSPDVKTKRTGGGWEIVWDKDSALVSNFNIGILTPHRLNPGPMASAMSGHAPVSLLFFFFLLFILQIVKDIKIHPMNYFFIACGFFAFNLLFAYLVDHVELKWSFLIASGVSILLVTSYMRLVVGARFAIIEVGLSQFFFQILFSFAHFYEGYTGLAITIGAIVTLAIVMQLTGRMDWEKKFGDGSGKFFGSGLLKNAINGGYARPEPKP